MDYDIMFSANPMIIIQIIMDYDIMFSANPMIIRL